MHSLRIVQRVFFILTFQVFRGSALAYLVPIVRVAELQKLRTVRSIGINIYSSAAKAYIDLLTFAID